MPTVTFREERHTHAAWLVAGGKPRSVVSEESDIPSPSIALEANAPSS